MTTTSGPSPEAVTMVTELEASGEMKDLENEFDFMADLGPEEMAELMEMIMDAVGFSDDDRKNPKKSKGKLVERMKQTMKWAGAEGFSMAEIKGDPAMAVKAVDAYGDKISSAGGTTAKRGAGGGVGGYGAKSASPSLFYEAEDAASVGMDSLNLGLVAPIMIALITDLLQQVAQVMREVMTGEAKLRADLIEGLNEAGQSAAEATYNATMEQADQLREQAKQHLINGIIAVCTAATMVVSFVAINYGVNRASRKKLAAGQRKQQQLEAQTNTARNDARSRGVNNDNVEADPAVARNREATDKQAQQNQHMEQKINNDRTMRNQLSTGLIQQIGTAATSFSSYVTTMAQVTMKEAEAAQQKIAALMNLLVQIFEKMYSASSDSSQKAWQQLQDVARALEEIKAIVGKIGWGQP